jgi:hypothetical protein
LVVGATTLAFGHLTPDVRLVAPSTGPLALGLVFGALQSLAFPLGSRALAFVRACLALVCHLLALVCDPVPLLSDPISLICKPLAPCQLGLTSLQSLLAHIDYPPIEVRCPAIGFTRSVGIMLSRHDPRLC